jgi:hypothetical protein
MYLLKNKTKFQLNVDLSPSAVTDPNQTIIVPPKGYRDYDLTGDEVAYVKKKYGKELIVKLKA